MVDYAAFIDVFADYARTISRRYDVGDVMYRLADQVVEVLPVDGAGVSVADPDGGLQFVSATHEDVVRVEGLQITLGEGPCQDAFRTGASVVSDDLRDDGRWARYRTEARDAGFLAVAGIPMRADEQKIGALDLYRRDAGSWSEEDVATAQTLADMASGYILNAITLNESEELSERLRNALDSRVVIEQAKGILAERHGVPTADAFERLRRHARSTRNRIHDVARQVVEDDLRL